MTGRLLFSFVWAGRRQLKFVRTNLCLLNLVWATCRLLILVRAGHRLLTRSVYFEMILGHKMGG